MPETEHRLFSRRATRIFLMSLMILAPFTLAAKPPDWSKVPAYAITVFYAGVASWEYVRSEDHGRGGTVVRSLKKTCGDCHINKKGEYALKTRQIINGQLVMPVSGKPLEPEPMNDMPGYLIINTQIAYDENNIYFRFIWPGSGLSVSRPELYNEGRGDRISIQVANRIRSFRNYGCLMVCHDDQTDMPDNKGPDINLYGYFTREKGRIVSKTKLENFLSNGQFIDLWVAGFEGDRIHTLDFHVLDDRISDTNDLTATGHYKDGHYEVILTRKLDTQDPGDIRLEHQACFHMGVGIHDKGMKGRKHYTSFAVSVGLAAEADIPAYKIQ